MSVRLTETAKSREYELNDRTATGSWAYVAFVTGESDPEDALYTAVVAAVPIRWNGLTRQSMRATPLGGGWYDVSVPFALEEGGQAPDPTAVAPTPDPSNPYPSTPERPGETDQIEHGFTLEITGVPVKLRQSIFTFSKTPRAGAVATDHNQAINVKDGEVEGVDSTAAVMKFSETKVFPFVTWKYIKQLRDLYGSTNIAPWGVFDANEVRFVGASLQIKKDGTVPIKFDFEVSQTETNIDIGNGITVPTKPGWYYLWCEYEQVAAGGGTTLATRPKCAYVERIFRHDDFTKFGLG